MELFAVDPEMEAVKGVLERKLSARASVRLLHDRKVLRFSDYTEVAAADDYDRKPKKVALDQKQKLRIRKELNEYKLTEMEVHPASRHMVRLYDDGPTIPGFAEHVDKRVRVTGYRDHGPLDGAMLFYGPHKTNPGYRSGVELDLPLGKHDGFLNDHRYFTCKPNHGIMVDPRKVTLLHEPPQQQQQPPPQQPASTAQAGPALPSPDEHFVQSEEPLGRGESTTNYGFGQRPAPAGGAFSGPVEPQTQGQAQVLGQAQAQGQGQPSPAHSAGPPQTALQAPVVTAAATAAMPVDPAPSGPGQSAPDAPGVRLPVAGSSETDGPALISLGGWRVGDPCLAPTPDGALGAAVITGFVLANDDADDDDDMAIVSVQGEPGRVWLSSLVEVATDAGVEAGVAGAAAELPSSSVSPTPVPAAGSAVDSTPAGYRGSDSSAAEVWTTPPTSPRSSFGGPELPGAADEAGHGAAGGDKLMCLPEIGAGGGDPSGGRRRESSGGDDDGGDDGFVELPPGALGHRFSSRTGVTYGFAAKTPAPPPSAGTDSG